MGNKNDVHHLRRALAEKEAECQNLAATLAIAIAKYAGGKASILDNEADLLTGCVLHAQDIPGGTLIAVIPASKAAREERERQLADPNSPLAIRAKQVMEAQSKLILPNKARGN